MRVLLRSLVAAAVLASLPIAAKAQSTTVPYDGLVFDDARHRLWYARFWTGHCTGLSLFVCFPGEPYWNETMKKLAATVPAQRRQAFAARLFQLGRKIGHEWAKGNDVRKISTDHIRAWYAKLDRIKDAEAAVAEIDAEAARLLGAR